MTACEDVFALMWVPFLSLLNYKCIFKHLYNYRKSPRLNSLKACFKLQGKHDWRISSQHKHARSWMRTLSLNAVNDSQLPGVKAQQASEPTSESSFEGHGEKRLSVISGGMRLTQLNGFLHF